ncbi:MAG TPA: phosphoadenosine phosphosulfate reductase family protein [Gammaproteobacteria bacterium]|nr:phosphoadenosine phosphosulfate reductase family protein [Gammaproteobacteria bacterium]
MLEKTARRLATALRPISAEHRIVRVINEFGREAVITTSFGPTSAVLLHMVSTVCSGIRVIHVRHGHETPGTLYFAKQCRKRFPIDLRVYEAPRLPVPAWDTAEFTEFCRAIKVEPMQRALAQENAGIWFAGLIHHETMERRRMLIAQKRLGAIAVYPILDWCLQDAILYCENFNLALNTDYFDPCKGPNQKLECGLHATDEHHATGTGRA